MMLVGWVVVIFGGLIFEGKVVMVFLLDKKVLFFKIYVLYELNKFGRDEFWDKIVFVGFVLNYMDWFCIFYFFIFGYGFGNIFGVKVYVF